MEKKFILCDLQPFAKKEDIQKAVDRVTDPKKEKAFLALLESLTNK